MSRGKAATVSCSHTNTRHVLLGCLADGKQVQDTRADDDEEEEDEEEESIYLNPVWVSSRPRSA